MRKEREKKRLGRPLLVGGGKQVYFKASSALLALLKEELIKQRIAHPGLSISRASVIRDLLWRGVKT
jgi:hypothetical protein